MSAGPVIEASEDDEIDDETLIQEEDIVITLTPLRPT
jgi:DNA gyrase/topoisomerase IV subunit A